MATRKDLNRQRRLLDKPTIVEVTIVDKEPIPGSRGIDTKVGQQEQHKDIEHTFTAEAIIDNEDGPVVTDKSDDVWNHLERVTTIVDNDETGRNIILKPNGVFDELASSYYMTEEVLFAFKEDKINLNLNFHIAQFDRESTYAGIDKPDLIQMISDRLMTLSGGGNVVSCTLVSGPTLYLDVPTSVWDSTLYPVYRLVIRATYDFPPPNTIDQIYFIHKLHPTRYLQCDDTVLETFSSYTILSMDPGLDIYFPVCFQLKLSENGLWVPKAGEDYLIKYEGGVSVVRVKLATDPARIVLIRPSNTGGFLFYEVNGADVPVGLIRVFRPDRTLATVITSTQLPAYLPR